MCLKNSKNVGFLHAVFKIVSVHCNGKVTARRLYICRHGERIDHVDSKWRLDPSNNYADPYLTSTGRNQASELGIYLKNANITAIVTSPFIRTAETAIHAHKAINNPAIPILIETGLSEWMNGWIFPRGDPVPSLKSPLQLKQTLSTHIDTSYTPSVYVKYPESSSSFRHRTYFTALKILKILQNTPGNLLIVTHGAVCEALAVVFSLGKSTSQIRPDSFTATYCSLTEIEMLPSPAPKLPGTAMTVLAQQAAGPAQYNATSADDPVHPRELYNELPGDKNALYSAVPRPAENGDLITMGFDSERWCRTIWKGSIIRLNDDSFLSTKELHYKRTLNNKL